MSKVVNLRQRRKAKARTEKEKKADQNRRIHGRTKAEKRKEAMEADLASRRLDGHKLDKDEPE